MGQCHHRIVAFTQDSPGWKPFEVVGGYIDQAGKGRDQQ
jgi:hypothetical protein